ncbi:MAG TPA: RNA polymerase sigma factor [Ktedonobacterales bacterium]|jgi:RNA polymerase sigma-70 factor (ECF subfamily)|nr:RNA polymerase sigma factor [Ktedonobacterales bacterium]
MSKTRAKHANVSSSQPDRALTDAELAAALADDLDRTFEQFVVSYQRRLFGFALRLCGNSQDAEEVAQDAFVRAYRALAAYPSARVRTLKVGPWLMQIALNVVRNRAQKRRVATVTLDEPSEAAAPRDIEGDTREQPEALAVGAELRGHLEMLLRRLPDHWRIPVVLRHVEGFTYQEIAQLLDQPPGTVKSAVHRGTQMLRESLLAERVEVW